MTCRDACGHNPQAQRFRGNRRHHRRDDDVYSRGARQRARNWDYRYCWMRDAYFVVAALKSLGDSDTTKRYVDFLMSIVDRAGDAPLRPLYDIVGGPIPDERVATHLAGYRGMGPVRVGNEARIQVQHDVYGARSFSPRATVVFSTER